MQHLREEVLLGGSALWAATHHAATQQLAGPQQAVVQDAELYRAVAQGLLPDVEGQGFVEDWTDGVAMDAGFTLLETLRAVY